MMVLAAFASDAQAQHSVPTNFTVETNGPNKVTAKWDAGTNPYPRYQIAFDNAAQPTTNYRFSTGKIPSETDPVTSATKRNQTLIISAPTDYIRADTWIGFLIRGCTGVEESECDGFGARTTDGRVARAQTPPRPMSGFRITPRAEELFLDNFTSNVDYRHSPRLKDNKGVVFFRGVSQGFDIDYTTNSSVGAQAATGTVLADGWVSAARGFEANGRRLQNLTDHTIYRIRMRYNSSNGTGAWIVRSGAPGLLLPTPEVTVAPQVRALNVTFSEVVGGARYIIQHRKVGASSWQSLTRTSEATVPIFNLEGGSRYEVRVRAERSTGTAGASEWWTHAAFTIPTYKIAWDGGTKTINEDAARPVTHGLTIVEGGPLSGTFNGKVRYASVESFSVADPANPNVELTIPAATARRGRTRWS